MDVSASALAAATRLLDMRWSVQVVPHRHPYEPGLHEATAARTRDDRIGVLFLGSNVGNFDPPGMRAFFTGVREALKPGDALLISADLVKPERDLLLAYDDPLGVTAAFNKNLLVRLNRDLRANFDLAQFDHRAVWNARESRVEMHLVSRRRQHIDVPEADVSLWLDEGEAIWTRSSCRSAARKRSRPRSPARASRPSIGGSTRRRSSWWCSRGCGSSAARQREIGRGGADRPRRPPRQRHAGTPRRTGRRVRWPRATMPGHAQSVGFTPGDAQRRQQQRLTHGDVTEQPQVVQDHGGDDAGHRHGQLHHGILGAQRQQREQQAEPGPARPSAASPAGQNSSVPWTSPRMSPPSRASRIAPAGIRRLTPSGARAT
ncbi:MAG: L-histidine N(alpha)-methyltransferase [Vicinamibacterales bacterium]